ncbi:MAG TPA: MEDS domain-containing protein [Methanomassiliicoccales archaeon]|nr:MEDS domain-containing protein [Methanomassiliicoccales archaeon]
MATLQGTATNNVRRSRKSRGLRATGIEVIGDVPWGTHFCQFYQDSQDLVEILVPYFKAGLDANEFCMWVTSEPLRVEKATEALKRAVPNLEVALDKGQIEILDYKDWYMKGGKFESSRVLDGWVTKLEESRKKGFEGLRLTGNTHWLEETQWNDFEQYEASVNSVIGKHRMIALCTYSIERCGANEILDVVANHQFALVRRHGDWSLIEGSHDARTREALKESEELYRHILQYAPTAIYEIDYAGPRFKSVNEAMCLLTGYTREELLAKNPNELLDAQSRHRFQERIRRGMAGENLAGGVEYKAMKKDGSELWVILNVKPTYKDGKLDGALVVGNDITERKRAESAIRESEAKFRSLFEYSSEGMALHELVNDEHGEPIDYRILDVNSVFTTITRISRGEAVGKLASELYGTGKPPYLDIYAEVARTGKAACFETYFQPMDKHFIISAFSPMNGRFATAFLDVSRQKKLEGELERRLRDLARSNDELQQFAYVASHDLQEPLRMVLAYLALLDSKYRDQLGSKAKEYVDFAMEGGNRMRRLIDDLLEYSRVDTRGKPFSRVDMNSVAAKTLEVLKVPLEETRADIVINHLPDVLADESQMIQVMQNLIGNAIKFHGAEVPQIHISASKAANEWVFAVKDNGIGLNMEHADKIFLMFQRLHAHDEYPGTGVGLAVTKKIIERHGGRIWVESEEGKGATFYFSIPLREKSSSTVGNHVVQTHQ